MTGLGERGHSAARVGGAGVKVEIVFGFGDGGGGGGGGVHEGFGDFGNGDVFVGGEEVFDAGNKVLEVGAESAVLETVGETVTDGAEAPEKLVASGLWGGSSRSRGHHRHACYFANSGFVIELY